MWLFFGLTSIITAIMNVVSWSKGKDPKYYRFASLSLTALTMCALYSDEARRVTASDWGGLMDVMPSMAPMLLICVIASILINGISLISRKGSPSNE